MRNGQTVSETVAASAEPFDARAGRQQELHAEPRRDGGGRAMCTPMATRGADRIRQPERGVHPQPHLQAAAGDRWRSGRRRGCGRQGRPRSPGHAAEEPFDHGHHGDCPRLALGGRHLHLASRRHLSRGIDQLQLQRPGRWLQPVAQPPRPAFPSRPPRRPDRRATRSPAPAAGTRALPLPPPRPGPSGRAGARRRPRRPPILFTSALAARRATPSSVEPACKPAHAGNRDDLHHGPQPVEFHPTLRRCQTTMDG